MTDPTSTSKTTESREYEWACSYPGCGLPPRLHGAPPDEPPNLTPAPLDGREALRERIEALIGEHDPLPGGQCRCGISPRPGELWLVHIIEAVALAALPDSGERPGLDVGALIAELSESPLPGARYAVDVVRRRLATPTRDAQPAEERLEAWQVSGIVTNDVITATQRAMQDAAERRTTFPVFVPEEDARSVAFAVIDAARAAVSLACLSSTSTATEDESL